MAGLAKQALILSFARVANYGLMFLSPLILVRLLSVPDFGRYREFLVYATILVSFAGFSIVDSLLIFVPRFPDQLKQLLRQSSTLVLGASAFVVAVSVLIDLAMNGALLGGFRWPLALYVLLFINFDFWESYWLAIRRPGSVFWYTTLRLLARVLTVVVAAYSSGRVETVVWALVALEAVRLLGAWIAFGAMPNDQGGRLSRVVLVEQVKFCIPWGVAVMLAMASRNIGNIAVVKSTGVAALAFYTVGMYAEPIITAIRNSISTVLLPEMVRRESTTEAMRVWNSAIAVNCVLLFPCAVVLFRFAEPLIVFAFGAAYGVAAPVMRVFTLMFVRECFDLTLPFRTLGKSTPFLRSGFIGLSLNALLVVVLVPRMGSRGAVVALVAGSVAEMGVLWDALGRELGIARLSLLPLKEVAKTAIAALLLLATLYIPLPLKAGWAALPLLSIGVAIYVLMLRVLKAQASDDILWRVRGALSGLRRSVS